MIEAFIAYLTSGGCYRQKARSEGISKPTMIMYSRKVASFFRSTSANHIHLPTDEEVHAMRARHLGSKPIHVSSPASCSSALPSINSSLVCISLSGISLLKNFNQVSVGPYALSPIRRWLDFPKLHVFLIPLNLDIATELGIVGNGRISATVAVPRD